MPRKEFALVKTLHPTAVDIVREDFILLGEGQKLQAETDCSFRWEKKKGKFETVVCSILAVGE